VLRKAKSYSGQLIQTVGLSQSHMKRLEEFLLPPGWNAGPFIHLGEGRHCESEVVFQRTQHSTVTSVWAPTQTTQTGVLRKNHWAMASPSKFEVRYQTAETLFHQDIQTPRRELKIRCAAEYFLTKFEVFG